MPSKSILSLAFIVSTAFAAPAFLAYLVKPLASRDGPDSCGPTLGDDPYAADVGFYSDKDCNDKIAFICVYTYKEVADGGPGGYSCNPGLLPDTTPFFAKVEDSPYDQMQIVFTRDQSCPPTGPGAVFATLIDNASCVEMNLGGDAPGISIFPNGGSGIARDLQPITKRADPKCDGFTIESSMHSSSRTVQVSNIVDCTSGAEAGCVITVGSEHTESVSTSFSSSAGASIEGVFSVEATLGQEYTSSSTTFIQEGFSVQAGQKGYLSAYSAATLFKGKFTGCDFGDSEQPGQVLAIKANGCE
jgi:hypothetical protein